MKLRKQVEVDVRHQNHFRVRRSFGSCSVSWEREVARGEHARLSILDVHIVDTGQVADASGDGNEALVLDGAGMGADADAGIGVLRVGEERNEKYLHTVVGHQAGQFREFHIVADEHADFCAVGVECLYAASAAETPTFDFVGSDMDFFIHLIGTVAAAEEAHVVEASVFLDERHTAGDDVDVVADGKFDEPFAYFVGVLCQSANGVRFAFIVEAGHQRSVEVFREKNEVALVVGNGINEIFHLLEQVVKSAVGAHLPLYESDADSGFLGDEVLCRRLVVDVVPLQQAGEVLRFLVVRKVVAHHLAYVEVVRQLEREYWVENFLLPHFVDIFAWAELVGVYPLRLLAN